jgi:hypothetical protein
MSFPTTTEITTAKNSTYNSGTDIATGYYFANTEDPSPVGKIRGFLKAFQDLIGWAENDADKVVNNTYRVFAKKTSAQTLPTAGYATVVFNDDSSTGQYDLNSNFNTTSGVYTAPVTGYYNVQYNVQTTGSNDIIALLYNPSYSNTAADRWLRGSRKTGTNVSADFAMTVKLTAGETIYPVLFCGGAGQSVEISAENNYLSINFVGF